MPSTWSASLYKVFIVHKILGKEVYWAQHTLFLAYGHIIIKVDVGVTNMKPQWKTLDL